MSHRVIRGLHYWYDLHCLEARGFIFAGVVAAMAGTGMLPFRKEGKLPKAAHRSTYQKEYGTDVLEVSPE